MGLAPAALLATGGALLVAGLAWTGLAGITGWGTGPGAARVEAMPGPDAVAGAVAEGPARGAPQGRREAVVEPQGAAALGGVWLVRGHVTQGRAGTLAGAPLRARILAGYVPGGATLAEETLVSDASGAFAWEVEPPTESARLELVATPAGHLPARLVLLLPPAEPAPGDLVLECLRLDAELAGLVRAPSGEPVPGATVTLGAERRAVSDASGRYRLAIASEQPEHALRAAAAESLVARADLAPFQSGEARDLDLVLAPGRVVRGCVRDGLGAPVEGARVASLWHALEGAPYGTATSDALGRYALLLDPDQDYVQLQASAEGRAPAKLEGQLLLDEEERWRGLLEPERLDFELGTGLRATGRVTDAQGQPLDGVLVSLAPPFHDPPLVTATDATGRFELAGLPRAEVQLTATRPRWTRRSLTLDVAAAPESATELALVLEPGTVVTGQVLDEDERPVPFARVGASWASAFTDEHGRFVLEGVPASTKRLTARAPGRAQAELALGETREDLVLRLVPSARLAGRVLDAASGEPVPSFTLCLSDPAEPGRRSQALPSSWDEIRMDAADGRFALEAAFPVGTAVGVEVRAEGYAPAALQRLESALSPDPEAGLLRLVRSTRVHGRVVDAASGEPVQFARVQRVLSPTDAAFDARRATTDADGRFELDGLPTGPMYLRVSHLLHAEAHDGPFELVGSVERRIELDHGATIAGSVRAPDGSGLADAEVQVAFTLPSQARWRWSTRARADGTFELANLPGGEMRVALKQTRELEEDPAGIGPLDGLGYTLSLPSAAQAVSLDLVETIQLGPRERRELVLQARGSATLSGTLGFAGALPAVLPVSLVRLDPQGRPTGAARGTFAEGGLFRFTHLEAGRYELRAELVLGPAQRATGTAPVEVTEGEEAHAFLELVRP